MMQMERLRWSRFGFRGDFKSPGGGVLGLRCPLDARGDRVVNCGWEKGLARDMPFDICGVFRC